MKDLRHDSRDMNVFKLSKRYMPINIKREIESQKIIVDKSVFHEQFYKTMYKKKLLTSNE